MRFTRNRQISLSLNSFGLRGMRVLATLVFLLGPHLAFAATFTVPDFYKIKDQIVDTGNMLIRWVPETLPRPAQKIVTTAYKIEEDGLTDLQILHSSIRAAVSVADLAGNWMGGVTVDLLTNANSISGNVLDSFLDATEHTTSSLLASGLTKTVLASPHVLVAKVGDAIFGVVDAARTLIEQTGGSALALSSDSQTSSVLSATTDFVNSSDRAVRNFWGNFFDFFTPKDNVTAPAVWPAPLPAPENNSATTAKVPEPTSVVTQVFPIRERIVERVVREPSPAPIKVLGVSQATLDLSLNELSNALKQEIYRVGAEAQRQSDGNFHAIALTQRVDQLNTVAISNATITGSTFTGSVAGTSGSFSGGVSGTTGTFSDILTAPKFSITGTGTSTILGDSAFDTSSLYVDSVNHRVGIATTSPTDIFSVNGPIFLGNVTPAFTPNRLYANGNNLYWAGSLIGGASTGNWVTDGTSAWRATGNVGVGTTTPSTKLDVLDTPVNENTPAATITRLFSGIAANPVVTMLLRNTNETAGGSDYQNEVHLRLQAGTTSDHRAYINFADYAGVDKWLTGRNALNAWILYDAEDTAHRMYLNSSANNGMSYINSVGTGAVQINNSRTGADVVGTGGFEVFNGGAIPSTSVFKVSPDDGNAVLTATSNGVGYAPASLLLKATQANYRGQGIFYYNQPSQTSWFSGVPYLTGTDKYVIGYKTSATWDSTVAQPSSALLTVQSNGNVGIGTPTPNNLLQVAGLIDFNNTDFDTKLGYQAGNNIVAGAQYNTFVGNQAGLSSATLSTNVADYNSAFGYQALFSNTTGLINTAIGAFSLSANTSGVGNTASGVSSLLANTSGSYNTAYGKDSFRNNTTGSSNTVIGYSTGLGITTGDNNTIIGANVSQLSAGLSNNIIIADGQGNRRINVNSAGNVGVGNINSANLFSVTPAQYSTGTASQSLTTITGAGTTFTSAMVGSQFIFADGTSAGTITAFTDTTHLTVSTSQTVSSFQAFNIVYTGLQVGSTGNVGIGTTAPASTLTVAGQGTGTAQIGSTGFGSNYTGISLSGALNTTNYNFLSSATNPLLWINRPTGGDISFRENNVAQMTIVATSGNVGIGTTTPSAKLDILDTALAGSGALAGSVLNLAQTWNTTGAPTAILLNVTNTASAFASNLIDLQVGGTSMFKVNKSGVLTTPQAASFGSTVTTAGGLTAGFAITTSGGQIGSTWTNPGTTGAFSHTATITNASNQNILKLSPTYNQTTATSVANTDLLINRTETSLGTTPGAQLLLDAQVGSVSKFSVSNTGIAALAGGLVSPKWYPSADSTTAIQINKADGATNVLNVDTTNGRVGIGMTPTDSFEVNGNIIISDAGVSGLRSLTMKRGGSVIGGWNTGSSRVQFQDNIGNGIVFQSSASATNMMIKNDGSVGIGTAAPATTLEVVGADLPFIVSGYGANNAGLISRKAQGTLASPTAVTANNYLTLFGGRGYQDNSAWSGNAGIITVKSAEAFTSTANGTYITFETTPIGSTTRAEKMRIADNGNVGIGTASPTLSKLQVYTSGTKAAVFEGVDSSGYNTWFKGTTAGFLMGQNNSKGMIQGVNAAGTAFDDTLINPNGGNVGIGTTSPGANLDVYSSTIGATTVIKVGDANNNIKLGVTGAYTGFWYNQTTPDAGNYFFQAGTNRTFFNAPSDGGTSYLDFRIANATKMRVQENGNVGIGLTPAATAKLDILDTTLAGSGSLAGSVLNLAQTWNTTGNPTAIALNVTDTASGAASKLMNLQVGGVNKFLVTKSGSLTISSSLTVNTGSIFVDSGYSVNAASGFLNVGGQSNSAAGYSVKLGGGTHTNSSGVYVPVLINPTYNQTLTAAATDLLINRTETVVGSGAQLLIDAQVGGVSKFKVSNTGNATAVGLLGNNLWTNFVYDLSGVGTNSLSLGNATITRTTSKADVQIAPTYNQTTATSVANTDLLINRTETSLGTTPGAQYLIDAQVGTVSKFNISNVGNGYFAGSVGIGTTAPAQKLDIVGKIRLAGVETDATSKYSYISNRHYTNAQPDFTMVEGGSELARNFVLFGGGASGQNAATELLFYTAANTTTTVGTEKMRIDNAGNVGIATTTPWRTLSVVGTMAINGLTTSTAGDALCITAGFEVATAGNTTCITSSQKTKTDISTITSEEAAHDILNLVPSVYTNIEKGDRRFGFIAEQANTVDARIVEYASEDRTLPSGLVIAKGDPSGFDYLRYPAVLTKFVQDLYASVQTLVAETKDITTKVGNLFARVISLEIFNQNQIANGITTKDQLTGEDYCVYVSGGVMKTTKGACGTSQSALVTGALSNGVMATSTAGVTISIHGNNPATINVGDTYGDLGATITAPTSALNLGIKVSIDGGSLIDMSNISIDTTGAGVHHIVYTVVDQSNATTTAERILNVISLAPPAPVATSTPIVATTTVAIASTTPSVI